MTRLDVNPNPVSFLDDLLLIICLPAFFIYSMLTIVAAIDGWGIDVKDGLEGAFFTHSVLVRILIFDFLSL